MGPTASGKSSLAIALAEHFRAAVLSVDSRQLYRGMDIGTGKVSPRERARVPHYMLDILSPEEDFSAADYQEQARACLASLFKARSTVIAAGGTGFYMKALEGELPAALPQIPASLRRQVQQALAENGLAALLQELAAADPACYHSIDRNNPRRVQRAIEVIRASGRPFSSFKAQKTSPLPWPVVKIGLHWEREALYRRINLRVEEMFAQGLVKEVETLLHRGYHPRKHKALQSIGYHEVVAYLKGELSYAECVALVQKNTRHYARRQLTWLRKEKEIRWFAPADKTAILTYLQEQRLALA